VLRKGLDCCRLAVLPEGGEDHLPACIEELHRRKRPCGIQSLADVRPPGRTLAGAAQVFQRIPQQVRIIIGRPAEREHCAPRSLQACRVVFVNLSDMALQVDIHVLARGVAEGLKE